ncbi:hypothetical protein GQ457_04G014700 [Hibiscus cannabinus]
MLGTALKRWGKTRKHSRVRLKENLEARLKELEEHDPVDNVLEDLINVKLGLNIEADKEELFWEQRARVNWLSNGDKNTSFFHQFATTRKRNNAIHDIDNGQGDKVSSTEDILHVASTYFSDLFSKSDTGDASGIYDNIHCRVTHVMNDALLTPFKREEIWVALKSMASLKAPGVDGFPVLFYKKFWSIVGDEVSDYCLAVLNGETELHSINKTHIVLIPKVKKPWGKEVYIKSILQAIPIYAMQCFLLPKAICSKLELAMNRFWWRNNASKNGIHWCSWSKLSMPKPYGGMGFRDLAKFNIALLAKQGWWIVTHPSSLLARVLKARYFPRTDFLSAQLGSSPSYTWRSIYSARGLLDKGLCWRIGTRLDVSVWNDVWLPGPGNGRIEGHTIDIRYTKVSDLIDPIRNEWNTMILSSLFESSLVDRILCISLARSKPPDSLVWRCEGSGQYSPKSGYRLLIDEELQPLSGNTNDQNILYSAFFKALWQLHVPSKCKIFLWRLFHNYVPLFDNLQQRRINVRNICPFCAEAAESNVHFVRECSFTRNLFDLLHIHVPDISQHQDYKAWLASVHPSLHKLKSFIYAHIAELDSIAALRSPSVSTGQDVWSPPEIDIIKFNFDTSFNPSAKSSVLGTLARNSPRSIMAACALAHDAIDNVFIAEANACEAAINFAIDLGFRTIQVEGDSLTVIKKLSSPPIDKSIISPIIQDIKSKLGFFEKITFSHVGRQGNQAAHALAKEGLHLSLPRYWIEEAPLAVEQIALREIK